jgi:hypothetical protein
MLNNQNFIKMDIYVLECTQITTGTGIEGFSVESKFFTDFKDATDEAYKMANKYHIQNAKLDKTHYNFKNSGENTDDKYDKYDKYYTNDVTNDVTNDDEYDDEYDDCKDENDRNIYKNGILVYDEYGAYCWDNTDYNEYPEYSIAIHKNTIDLSKKIIMTTCVSD